MLALAHDDGFSPFGTGPAPIGPCVIYLRGNVAGPMSANATITPPFFKPRCDHSVKAEPFLGWPQ